jgi:hypothetical protein
MIGRKTKGGLVMMSRPLMPPPPGRAPDAWEFPAAEGVGDDVSTGEGEVDAVGVGAGWRAKLAQGFGWTLAHSLCAAGLSLANGLTAFVKEPLSSVTTVVATWLETSQ